MPTKYAYVDGVAVHYVHAGRTTLPDVVPNLERGQLAVFLHDAGGNAGIWRHVTPLLDDEHSAIAFDFPGHGRSGGTSGLESIDACARFFAGLAGAWFTLDFGTNFQSGMTNGRGFIALAALIFGRWIPLGAFGAAMLFAAASSLSVSIRTIPPTGQLGDILTAIPDQFWSALPYIVTIVVLAGVVGRSVAPAAVGKPYEREGTS